MVNTAHPSSTLPEKGGLSSDGACSPPSVRCLVSFDFLLGFNLFSILKRKNTLNVELEAVKKNK